MRKQLLCYFDKNPRPSKSNVSQLCSCDPRVVTKHWKRFAIGNRSLQDEPRTGRPRSLTAADKKTIDQHFERNSSASVPAATQLVNKRRAEDDAVCKRTVRRYVKRAESRFEYRLVTQKGVSDKNAAERVEATRPAKRACTKRNLHTLVFADAAFVRWHTKKHFMKPYRFTKAWHVDGVPPETQPGPWKLFQFYAAATLGPDGVGYLSDLIFVPAGKGLTSSVVKKTVFTPLQKWARDSVFHGAPHMWVIDRARVHTSKETSQWMTQHQFILAEHPAQSPDMNRIEPIWLLLKAALATKRPRSVESCKQVLRDVWKHLSRDHVSRVIHALPDVMKQVHEKPGKLVQKVM